MERLYLFTINGQVIADDEEDARTVLGNLMNHKSIEEYKIENLMTEAKR